ncbi:hypothetical protein HDU80_000293 [Chytriomyces hyalinus]|nr:hypothetical protein HDU80_000293 [Chytriomyces hyalinus]
METDIIAPNTTGPGPPIEQTLPPSKMRRLSLAIKPAVNTASSSLLQPTAKHQKSVTSFFSAPRHTQSKDYFKYLFKKSTINIDYTCFARFIYLKTIKSLSVFSVLRDSSNSTHATSSKATNANMPIIVNDSDDDFEDTHLITNSRIQQPKAILTAMKRQREKEDSDEESGEKLVNPPGEYLGVQLTDLGKKNWDKLLNPKSGRIVEPPKKKCQKCDDWMDWRVDGRIQKQKNGVYTYQGYCAGACAATLYYLESIDDCVDKMASWARGKDLENGFEVNCTPEESREIFHAAWAKHDGNCSCCKVKLLAIGNGANTISKQRNKPGLGYHDPLQDLDFLCIPCNRLRDEFSAREVQDVFKKIHEAAQKRYQPRAPSPDEVKQIKRMKSSNYNSEDSCIKQVVKRNGWALSPTANSTASAQEFVDVAKGAGCIGVHSELLIIIDNVPYIN